MEKKLTLGKTPIKGLHYLGNPLAILFTDEEVLPWFYSDYVQLIWYKNEKFLSFHGKYISEIPTCIPWLEFQCMDKLFITNFVDIHQLIINSINCGWYVISAYDEYYISNTPHYQKEHFNHDFMIYGYDLEAKKYITNVYTEKFALAQNLIGFSEFEKGFFANTSSDFEFNRINLYKKKTNFSYDFDKKKLIAQLQDYLHSTCSDRRYTVPYGHSERVFGLEIYTHIINIYKYKDEELKDARILYLLWEHKKCMNQRIQYMVSNGILKKNSILLDMFGEIEKIATISRFLQIKLYVLNDITISDKIVFYIEQMRSKEKVAMEILLEELLISTC